MSGLGIALTAGVMAVGLFGTVVPVMPGLVLMWLAALVYGLAGGWGTVGVIAFAVITVILVGGTILSYVMPHRAGVRGGAAKLSMRLGIVGAIFGFFVIPLFGVAIGGIAGVMAGEYQRLGNGAAAWATTKTVIVGFVKAALVEFLSGLAILGTWIAWVVASR